MEVREGLRRRAAELESYTARNLSNLVQVRSLSGEEDAVVQRLGAHIERAGALLDGGGEVGRAFEFLVQEMLRETNTLGSKSQDVHIAHTVVAMKSAIDRLKEQAANLE